ncbi:expressed unknown protein [Seminavis robusta]|uniref:Orc1-like AAA ATPase domain-containing protein n=1 Tax=Seminavis robusta TaxID=568900 RepID=A0A9N8HKC3_9STRA|nr:expressed unknown protein [Seminavis robusta]|eukprot:Sro606_g174510.1 n/a (228) ;mRNA; r:36830-37513
MKFLKRSSESSRGPTRKSTQECMDRSSGTGVTGRSSTVMNSERTSSRSFRSDSKSMDSQFSLGACGGSRKSCFNESSSALFTVSGSSEPKGAVRRRSILSLDGSVELVADSSIVKATPLRNSRTLDSQSKYNSFLSSNLRFDRLGLVGRVEEQQVLFDALDRVYKGSREPVLVSGESGSGKTALTACLRKKINLKTNGAFVSGKFNPEDQAGVPYRASPTLAHKSSK